MGFLEFLLITLLTTFTQNKTANLVLDFSLDYLISETNKSFIHIITFTEFRLKMLLIKYFKLETIVVRNLQLTQI